MTPQHERAAHLAAIAQHPSPAPTFAEVGSWMVWGPQYLAAACEAAREDAPLLAAEVDPGHAERSMRPRKDSRVTRFARSAVRLARKVATA